MSQSDVFTLRTPCGFTIKDARGFNVAGGAIGRSLSWPLPATVAGATRTAVGDAAGWYLNPGVARWGDLLTDVEVAGPLAIGRDVAASNDWAPLFPCPRDAVGLPRRCVWLAPSPRASARGTWTPTRPPEEVAADQLWWPRLTAKDKPEQLPIWWRRDAGIDWLLDPRDGPMPARGPRTTGRIDMHLAIDQERLTAQSGKLFGLETQETLLRQGASFEEIGFRVQVTRNARNGNLPPPPASVWRFGGEARVAEAIPQTDPWSFPKEFESWVDSPRFRLLVVSPACFEHGWLPDGFRVGGSPPTFIKSLSLPGGSLRVTLRAAYVGRPVPLSGWDFVANAPKASRLLVPIGSVYYFEADRPLGIDDARALWLTSLQEKGTQEASDGFGLVVPGAWPTSHAD